MRTVMMIGGLLAASLSTQGCVLAAGAAAGVIAVDEINEDDGEFDPLEEAYDGDPSTAGPLDKE